MHPGFPQNRSFDFSLCVLDKTLPAPPAKLGASTPEKGALIYLAGYGCRKEGGVDAEYGKFGWGPAWVVQQPGQVPDLDTITVGAALCNGDAGGGAYLFDNHQTPLLVGVNSASDLRVKSNIAATATPTFVSWAKQWAEKSGPEAIICGLHENAACDTNAERDEYTVTTRDLLTKFHSDSPLLAFLPSAEKLNADFLADPTMAVDLFASSTADAEFLANPKTAVRQGERTDETIFQICGTSQADASAVVCKKFAPDVVVTRKVRIIVRKGETIDQRVLQLCGKDQPDAWFEQYREVNKNPGIKTNTELAEDKEVWIPVCTPARPRLQIGEVQPSENDYEIWKRYDVKWRYDGDLTRTSIQSSNFKDVFRELNRPFMKNSQLVPGSFVVIPTEPLHDEIAPSPAVVNTQPDTGVFGLSAVPAETECGDPSGNQKYPYSLSELLDVLRENKYARRFDRKPVTILVADSGIFGVSNAGVFTQDLFLPGADLDDTAQNVRPGFDKPLEEAEHGTLVASIILGGPLFARMQVAEHSRVNFIVKQVYLRGDGSKSTVPDGWETDILTIINDIHPGIVNLSIKSRKDRARNAIQKEGAPLFVVAAGNLDGDIDDKEIYPAKYGGLKSNNVITVGATALNKQGKVVWGIFSNRSSRYIDIAAPGCEVPALSYNSNTMKWSDKLVTGTSFSAPLVSFAAAMITTELGAPIPADLKRRLLASADLHPEFKNEVNQGRTLNLVKALSLYQDLVELAPEEYTKGDVKFLGPDPRTGGSGELRENIPATCVGRPDRFLKINQIYKIRPKFEATTIVYYKGNRDEVFQILECTFAPELKVQISVEKRDPAATKPKIEILATKPINEILDFVPKYRPFSSIQ